MQRTYQRRNLLAASLGALTAACMHPDTASAPSADPDILPLIRLRILQQRVALTAVVVTQSPRGRRDIVVQDPRTALPSALDADSIFEIASLTKVFTALLLAVEVVQGRARLDDPLQAYVPSGVEAPSFEGRQITLLDLATHGSGLPLRPANLNALPDAPNKYANFTLEALYQGLASHRLTRAPGTQFEYSNLAFALLGQGIALRAGKSYEETLRERVLAPLGLRDTALTDSPRDAHRRAQGHDLDLNPIGATSFGALGPAGGLRSTASDLIKLIDLFTNRTGPRELVDAAQLMLSVDRPGDNETTRMALGWRRSTRHGETYYWSNGSGDGSRSYMGFNLARERNVVALADAASGAGLDDICQRFMDAQQDVDTVVVEPPVFVTLPEDVLSRAFGRYEYAPDDVFEITRGATGLIASASFGQLVIKPQSPTRYASRMAPGLVFEFTGADVGPARTLILHQDGQAFVYRRVPGN